MHRSGRKSISSTTGTSAAPSEMSTEDIIANLEVEFDLAGEDIIPDDGIVSFRQFETKLKRKADWEERLQTVTRIASLCKGTDDPKKAAAEFRAIVPAFTECLLDARSTLMKGTCIALVSIAKSLGHRLDQCSFLLIPQLLDKTNNGTAFIAHTARFTVINFVKYVYGKNTKAALESNISSASEDVRYTTLQAMIATFSTWPESYAGCFQTYINSAKSDKSAKIRSLAAEFANDDSISAVSAKSTASKIPIKQKLTDSNKSKKSSIPSQTPAKDNGITPSKIPRCAFAGKTPLREDTGLTPLRPVSTHGKKAARAAREDDGKTPMKKAAAENDDFIPDPEPYEEHEISDEQKQAIEEVIAKNDAEVLSSYIEKESPDLFGFLPPVMDILIGEMQKSSKMSVKIVTQLCSLCPTYLSPYVIDILRYLSEDEQVGKSIISVLSTTYGEKGIMGLLYASELPWAFTMILEKAINSDDLAELTRAALGTIKRDLYSQNVSLVVDAIAKIDKISRKTAVRVLLAINEEQRISILADVGTKIPELDALFKDPESSAVMKMLHKELVNAKAGRPVDIDMLQEAMANEETQTMLITIIKESKTFNSEFIPLLVLCTEESESVASYAGSVLKEICETNPTIISAFADIISPTHGCFFAFTGFIGKAQKEEVVAAMESLKLQMIASLEIEDLRRDVLDIVAAAVVTYGEEFKSFLGELDNENVVTLETLIKIRKEPAN